MKSYPPVATLDIRLRQLRPDLVFLDLTTDLDAAAELIEFIAAIRPPVFVVGLHTNNDSEAILRSLRAGATEFLYAPFDVEMQRQALGRISRLRKPSSPIENRARPADRLLQLQARIRRFDAWPARPPLPSARDPGKRVLLADFDLRNGSLAFFLKVSPWYSLLDAMKQIEEAGRAGLVVAGVRARKDSMFCRRRTRRPP